MKIILEIRRAARVWNFLAPIWFVQVETKQDKLSALWLLLPVHWNKLHLQNIFIAVTCYAKYQAGGKYLQKYSVSLEMIKSSTNQIFSFQHSTYLQSFCCPRHRIQQICRKIYSLKSIIINQCTSSSFRKRKSLSIRLSQILHYMLQWPRRKLMLSSF